MKTFEDIKKILEQQKEFLKNKYKIKEIGIFGSFVRGDITEDSDVDILVEFEEVPSLFKFIEIENYLSNILGIKVDLVEKKVP
ncbi:MAG: putative nucleotidyltransferase MJ0435 [Thermodesulfobacteria bacterium]|nr:nucleotidyltransferase family protein [Thermodesulfobacteriota bacterium]MCU4138902.1 putative nucleotidyltransferase MJ0435 [Thermodesulfobacteriota bacterium]